MHLKHDYRNEARNIATCKKNKITVIISKLLFNFFYDVCGH